MKTRFWHSSPAGPPYPFAHLLVIAGTTCPAQAPTGHAPFGYVNVWLVVPNDEGVFHGAAEHEGIRCVHPVQVYLDLKNHPERSAEAAEQLRAKVLSKGGHA